MKTIGYINMPHRVTNSRDLPVCMGMPAQPRVYQNPVENEGPHTSDDGTPFYAPDLFTLYLTPGKKVAGRIDIHALLRALYGEERSHGRDLYVYFHEGSLESDTHTELFTPAEAALENRGLPCGSGWVPVEF